MVKEGTTVPPSLPPPFYPFQGDPANPRSTRYVSLEQPSANLTANLPYVCSRLLLSVTHACTGRALSISSSYYIIFVRSKFKKVFYCMFHVSSLYLSSAQAFALPIRHHHRIRLIKKLEHHPFSPCRLRKEPPFP